MAVTWWWYPTKRWTIDGRAFELRAVARTDGFVTQLHADGAPVSEDRTPIMGPEAVRNHRHVGPDGLEIEAGYVSLWAVGALTRRDGQLLHETHPGRTVAFPDKWRDQTVNASMGGEKWRRNRLPLAVDIACGLLFFVLAKTIGLVNAALVMATIGVLLVVGQRLTRLDLTGGLALFGIAVSCASAAFAWWFQDPEIVKLRGTIIGSGVSALFLLDGLLGGKRLASALLRYMPYDDMDAGRLGIGMGVMGFAMALLNFAVARLASTDLWLFYTTFLDTAIVLFAMFAVISYARGTWGKRQPG